MTGFSHPEFLWAMAGIIIPVIIHLLSRKQAGIIYAGSLRHLHVSFSKQFKNIRLNEYLLLFLRIVMIILLSLFISGLLWNDNAGNKKWVLFEEGTEKDVSIVKIADSLKAVGYEAHFLAPGFPKTLNDKKPERIVSYWQLAEELKSLPVSEAVVFSRQYASKFHGRRTSFPINQHWITVESPPQTYVVSARMKENTDSVMIRRGNTSSGSTYFDDGLARRNPAEKYFKLTSKSVDSLLILPPKEIVVEIVTDPGFENDRSIIATCIDVLNKQNRFHITTLEPASKSANDKPDWIIRLSNTFSSPADSVKEIIFRQQKAASLFVRLGIRSFILTSRLSNDNAVSENVTLSLGKILYDAVAEENLAGLNDRRVLNSAVWSSTEKESTDESNHSEPKDKSVILIIAFLAVLITERFIAQSRNQ